MSDNSVSILDGSTFLVSSPNGDIEAGPDQPHGLFFKDMRHLSKWKLTIGGIPLDVLSTDSLEYYYAQHFCVPPTGTIYKNPTLSIVRRRFVGNGFVEDLSVLNHGTEPEEVELRLEVESDFCDLFEVKDSLKKKGKYYQQIRDKRLVLGYKRDDFVRETQISSSVPPTEMDMSSVVFRQKIAPKTTWSIKLSVTPVTGDTIHKPKFATAEGAAMRRNLTEWIQGAPTVTCHPEAVRLYMRSLVDVAALRFRPDNEHSLPAAGLPWFMALFGRDSLLTSYQMLPFGSELAATALRALADTQGKKEVDLTEEEPGRILHELRFGELTHFKERPQSPYYGASDTTPLFLVLLDEYERWTGDVKLVRALEPNARAALNWIDKFGDRDGDGYIEYERKTELGLDNQCWKDSWNSILYHDGKLSTTPRATCEIQGFAYDAKVRTARLARTIWKDEALAVKLEKEAAELKQRFNKDFWVPDRKFFAVALDGSKKKVDSLCSNIGQLLWSGIVDDDKATALRDHLMSPKMFSGWGIRTMAEGEGGYNPIEYHNGTVWPHDCSFIAAGLARYGFRKEASQIIAGIFEAGLFFRYRLPEVFAGYERSKTRFPVQYPTASSPQAWAAGTPMLGFRVLLGLEPKGEVLTAAPDPVLPNWLGTLTIEGIPGRWGRANITAKGDDKNMLSVKQMYETILSVRSTLGEEDLAA
ncbi:MAG TPA: glycogen debranching N-terminal domain-containing protein [Verrucomicrobiae bacterium]|nr:glycogen debranching N-terminal domain-containing protein [Verrucomicrobiae bacterium]